MEVAICETGRKIVVYESRRWSLFMFCLCPVTPLYLFVLHPLAVYILLFSWNILLELWQ